MPLAVQALTPIVMPVAGIGITCHQAVWYWAALEADAQGLTAPRPILTRMANIAGIPNGAQAAMLALPRAGMLNFAQNGNNSQSNTQQLVIPDSSLSAVDTTQIYSRLNLRGGLDIRV